MCCVVSYNHTIYSNEFQINYGLIKHKQLKKIYLVKFIVFIDIYNKILAIILILKNHRRLMKVINNHKHFSFRLIKTCDRNTKY